MKHFVRSAEFQQPPLVVDAIVANHVTDVISCGADRTLK